MTDFRYPYRPKFTTYLWVMLFFGSCAAFFVYRTINNEVGMVINGLLELSQNGATIFYGFLAALSLGFVGIGLMALFQRITKKGRDVVVGAESISSPKSGVSSKIITVMYTDIKQIEILSVSGTDILVIRHKAGKLEIPHVMLPNKKVFFEMVKLISQNQSQYLANGLD